MGEPGLGRTIVADVEGAHKIELLVRGCVVGFIMSLRGSVTARAKHDSTASMPKEPKKPLEPKNQGRKLFGGALAPTRVPGTTRAPAVYGTLRTA